MHCLRLSRSCKASGTYLALALVLCCSGIARADRFAPDPVLEFRQALSLSLREYMPRDPEQLAKLENGPADQRAAFLKNARTSDLLHRMELLKTVPEMRRALGAQEWREKGSDEQNKIDSDIRDILINRFAKIVTDTLENGSQLAKLAMMGMLAEIGTNNRLLEDQTRIAKVFTPALTKLIRSAGNRDIRMAAARTVSQIGCDPAAAAPALGELLQSKDAGERRAAAEGLAGIIQLLNNLSNQSKEDLTNERAILSGMPPADNSLVLFAQGSH